MTFRGDERGVTVQIGAVLLLGILVISLSMYQVTVVPDQNREVEFQHSLDVKSDLETLRGAILSSGTGGGSRPTIVTLGTRYPSRTIFINPPPVTGSLRTVNHSRISVSNAKADGEVGDFWTGSGSHSYESRAIVYEPGYHVFRNAPNTTYESSLVYNRFENRGNTTVTGQSVIQGRQITLVAVNGTLQAAQSGTVTVDAEAVSESSRTVTVSGAGGNPVVVTIPSAVSNRTWERILREEGELDPDGTGEDSYVRRVRPAGPNSVRLVLEAGTRYNLRMGKVGVGTGANGTEAAYVTDVEMPDPTVDNDTTHRAVLEVRDRFNNPVSGETVTAGATLGEFDNATRRTDSRGRAEFLYTAPGPAEVGNADTLTFEIGGGGSRQKNVSHGVKIAGAGGAAPGSSGGRTPGDSINPNSTDAVVLSGSKIVGSSCASGGSVCRVVDVGLKNLDQEDVQNVTEVRFNFYSTDATSNNKRDPPKSAIIENTTARQVVTAASEGGQYVTVSPEFGVSAGRTRVLRFNFSSATDGTSDFDVEQGDFFVFSVIIDGSKSATYFVAPTVNGTIDGGSGGTGGSGGSGSGSPTFDGFEDGDVSEYGGDTSKFSAVTAPVRSGSYALRGAASGSEKAIKSVGGLNAYPQRGDQFTADVRFDGTQNDGPDAIRTIVGSSHGRDLGVILRRTGSTNYEVSVFNGSAEKRINSLSLDPNRWYGLEIVWNGDETAFTARLLDSSGNVLVDGTGFAEQQTYVSVSDTDPKLGFGVRSGTAYWDNATKT